MLRDDYTALNLAAIGYHMLHTTGMGLQNQATADLALRHLKDRDSFTLRPAKGNTSSFRIDAENFNRDDVAHA
jgi:hypothetical protein